MNKQVLSIEQMQYLQELGRTHRQPRGHFPSRGGGAIHKRNDQAIKEEVIWIGFYIRGGGDNRHN